MTTLTCLESIRSANDADLDAAAGHFNRLRAETHPDDPPAPVAEMRAALRSIPATVDVWPWWLCRTDQTDRTEQGEVVGECHLFGGSGADAHVLNVELGVQREYRRRGIATSILRAVVRTAEANERTVLRATTTEQIPAGGAFCQRLGATPISARHTNRLHLAGLDREQVAAWSESATGYELLAVDGPCPPDQVEDLVTMLRMVNDDESFTADRIREGERMDAATRATRWLLLARSAGGELAGFTEVMWYANNPRVIQQRWTYVHPGHRRHGVGRTLKATMLARILSEAAEAAYVDTQNDDANAPMLAINQALGFRPHIAETTWQVEVADVRACLG